jgi:hypothetical protein
VASLRAVVATAAALVALAAGGAATLTEPAPSTTSAALARSVDGRTGSSPINARARAAITWRGGPITASTGEVIHMFVSDLLPAETPEKWAEFLAGVAHGPELPTATVRLASLTEVQDLCGASALGCYRANEIVSLGEPDSESQATPEEVLRHEYGHHVAFHRTNAPWRAVDWGPKRWASAAGVCARVSRGEAFPGGGGRNYANNPGEAWAEVYRLMDERRAGITTATWPIISRSFFPTEAMLAAAEQDVVAPWSAPTRTVHRRVFGRLTRKIWWIPLQTPLDGELTVRVNVPRSGVQEVAVVAPNRRRVIKRAQWSSQRVLSTNATVCGQRSLFVRVTASGSGRVTVTASTP